MKKIVLILIAASAMLLFSCVGKSYGILDYQNNDITAECTVNGKYSIIIVNKEESCTLEVASPEVTFERCGDENYICCKDMKIPTEAYKIGGINALMNIFSLSEGSIKTLGGNGESGKIAFDMGALVYTVTFSKSGLPTSVTISGDYNYEVSIDAIRLEKR